MTWLMWLYVGALAVTVLVVWCSIAHAGQPREDKRVARRLRGK